MEEDQAGRERPGGVARPQEFGDSRSAAVVAGCRDNANGGDGL